MLVGEGALLLALEAAAAAGAAAPGGCAPSGARRLPKLAVTSAASACACRRVGLSVKKERMHK